MKNKQRIHENGRLGGGLRGREQMIELNVMLRLIPFSLGRARAKVVKF